MPGSSLTNPHLLVSNPGHHQGGALLEGIVKDFDDSTDVFYSFGCPHNAYVTTAPDQRKTKTEGISVRMPARFLKPAYEEWLARGGRKVELAWTPGVSDTVMLGKLS